MLVRSSRVVPWLFLAASLGAGRAHAGTSPAVRQVIEAYLKATGGRAAFQAESTLHVKGRITAMGLNGTFEAWSKAPNRTLTSLRLGSIRMLAGCDGATAWRTDLASRTVAPLDGKDLEAALADAWFQNECWARSDFGGGKVTLGSKAFGDDGVQQALEVNPPVGPRRRLWFSRKTGLLVRVVTRRDRHEWSERLSGYRKIAGRIRALASDSGEPKQADFQHLQVDSVWANPRLDSTRFAAPDLPVSTLGWLGRPGAARLPFHYGGRHILLEASVDGAPPADFLLDTGASVTMIDSAYAAEIGLEPEGRVEAAGLGAEGAAAFSTVDALRLTAPDGDGVEIRDVSVGVMDIGPALEPVLWRRPAGIIGSDLIGRFVLEIDYDRETIGFHDPATFVYRGGGEAIPMGLAGGIPRVAVEIDGACRGDFLIDLGSSFNLNVHGSMVRPCRILATPRREVEIDAGGLGGSFTSTLCRLDSVRVGSYHWTQPIAALSLTTAGTAGSHEYAGLLGNGALQRFKCTLDYRRRQLYLEPGRRFAERDRLSRSGTTFVRLGDRVIAAEVTRGSSAEEAGLKPLDEVTSIDGRSVLGYTLEDLDRLFVDGPEGSTHAITVRREGAETTVTITLRDIL